LLDTQLSEVAFSHKWVLLIGKYFKFVVETSFVKIFSNGNLSECFNLYL